MPRSVPESATHLDGKKLIKCEDSELEEGEIGHSSPSVLGDFDRMSVAPCDSALHGKYLILSIETPLTAPSSTSTCFLRVRNA